MSNFAMVPPLDLDSRQAAGGHERDYTWQDDAGYTRLARVVWLYNATGAAIVAGEVFVERWDGDADINPKAAAVTNSAAGVAERTVVAVEAVAIAGWGYFAVRGYIEASTHGGTDADKDDYLKPTTGQKYLVEDTTSQTANSVGIYSDDTSQTPASAANRLVYLFGQPRVIA